MVKKITTFIATLTLILGTTSYAQFSDTGFEAGSPSSAWAEASTNFGSPICDGPGCGDCGGPCIPNTGSFYVWFGGAQAAEVGSVEQTITITSGTSASINFMMRIAIPGPNGAADKVDLIVDGNVLETITSLDSSTYSNYASVSVDVSALADGATHTVRFEGTQPTGQGNFLLDDVSLTVDGITTGLFEKAKKGADFLIYPNPVNDVINLNFSELKGQVDVVVYSIDGSAISETTFNEVANRTFTLSTEKMENGVYFIDVTNNGRKTTKRVVVAK